MVDAIVQGGGLRVRLLDAKESKGPSVRYTIRVEDAASSRTFFEVYGWRISKGKLYVPARATKVGWVDQAKLSMEGEESLVQLVAAWRDEFPGVEFPGV